MKMNEHGEWEVPVWAEHTTMSGRIAFVDDDAESDDLVWLTLEQAEVWANVKGSGQGQDWTRKAGRAALYEFSYGEE